VLEEVEGVLVLEDVVNDVLLEEVVLDEVLVEDAGMLVLDEVLVEDAGMLVLDEVLVLVVVGIVGHRQSSPQVAPRAPHCAPGGSQSSPGSIAWLPQVQVHAALQLRNAPHGLPLLPGGSHCSPGSTMPSPHDSCWAGVAGTRASAAAPTTSKIKYDALLLDIGPSGKAMAGIRLHTTSRPSMFPCHRSSAGDGSCPIRDEKLN
jgi:hypothetical protein